MTIASRLIGQYLYAGYPELAYIIICEAAIRYIETADGEELYVFTDLSGLGITGTTQRLLTEAEVQQIDLQTN